MQPEYIEELFTTFNGDVKKWLTEGIVFMDSENRRLLDKFPLGLCVESNIKKRKHDLQKELKFKEKSLEKYECEAFLEKEQLKQFILFNDGTRQCICESKKRVKLLKKTRDMIKERIDQKKNTYLREKLKKVLKDIESAIDEYETEEKYATTRSECSFDEFNELFFNSDAVKIKAQVVWLTNEIAKLNYFLKMYKKHKKAMRAFLGDLNDKNNTNESLGIR